jgi:toxin ParE1/3/4
VEIIYHRLISRDLRCALAYYEVEGGTKLADRFFEEVEEAIRAIRKQPTGHHFSDGGLRRVPLKSFPYHFLFEVADSAIWIAVLRHDRRHPSFGLKRTR